MLSSDERIKEAINIAFKYGQIDGSHHRLWAIDQIVRVLCGDIGTYAKFISDYETDENGKEYEWDTGIAP
jgi:hypothetical protein